MTRDDEDAAALIACLEVVFQTFATKKVRAVFAGVPGHLAEFGELPAEIAIELLEKHAAFRYGKLRVGKVEVAFAGGAQAAEGMKRNCAYACTQVAGEISGQKAEKLHQKPHCTEL
jgi:hypothetical protein